MVINRVRHDVGRLLEATGVDVAVRSGIGAMERRLRRSGGDEIIYLVSLAGNPNYGDELVLRTWLRYLAQVRPAATVVVDVAHIGQAQLMFDGDHPRAVFADTLWRLAREPDRRIDGYDDLSANDWVAIAATELGAAPAVAEGVDRLLRAGSVHIVGGGFINALWPQWFPVVSAVAAVARKTGARAFATGMGLMPAPTGSAWERLALDAAEFEVFDVRDDASFTALAGVPRRSFTGDDVWLGFADPRSGPARAPAPTDGVVLCLQDDLTEEFEWGGARGADALARFVDETLDAWGISGAHITVVEGIPRSDGRVPRLLADRLSGASFIPFLDIWRGGLPVGMGHTWISTRFHPHLVAAAAGDSGVAIATNADYYGVKHRSLVAAGSRWTTVTTADRVPARPSSGGFSAADRARNARRKAELAATLYPD